MLTKTKGIVINHLKYRESSIIVRIFTADLGLQSYIVNGVRSSRAKNRMALFQPLTLLDLVVYHHESQTRINRISEVRCHYPFQSIPFEVKKAVVAMFLTEILSKTLQGEYKNEALFQFLEGSIRYFDGLEQQYENFHLIFLLRLCHYLGFAPQDGKDFFDQIIAFRHSTLPMQAYNSERILIDNLLVSDYSQNVVISPKQRREIIDYLMDYFQIHTDNFQVVKSLEVIREMNQ